jgi:TFIIF-interacting CTD phosphatase-like protein
MGFPRKKKNPNPPTPTRSFKVSYPFFFSNDKTTRLDFDTVFDIKMPNGVPKKIGVRLRPGCIGFLRGVSKIYEVVIFTASQEDYANKIVDFLQGEMGPGFEGSLGKRLYRQHCRLYDSMFF